MPTLEKKLQTRIKVAARKLGLNERELINSAVLSYLSELNEWRGLREELRLWDSLSAETMRRHKF